MTDSRKPSNRTRPLVQVTWRFAVRLGRGVAAMASWRSPTASHLRSQHEDDHVRDQAMPRRACSLHPPSAVSWWSPWRYRGRPRRTAAVRPCAASSRSPTRSVRSAVSIGQLPRRPPRDRRHADGDLAAAGGPAVLAALKTYFDANPQVAKDMQALQQPLHGLSARCKLPLTCPRRWACCRGRSRRPARSRGVKLPVRSQASACRHHRASRRRRRTRHRTAAGRRTTPRYSSRAFRDAIHVSARKARKS